MSPLIGGLAFGLDPIKRPMRGTPAAGCASAAMGLTNAAPAKSGYAAAPARIVMKFRRLIPSPVDPTLRMDYGSIELLPKGCTNGDFPPN